MEIEQVAQILGACYFLKAPKHVFITDEVVTGHHNHVTRYRGLQPKYRGDAIFLSHDADESTPIHESIHAHLGVGEPTTDVLTRIVMRKNEVLNNFPNLKNLLQKQLSYQKVESSQEFPEAHSPQFRGRVEHYIQRM